MSLIISISYYKSSTKFHNPNLKIFKNMIPIPPISILSMGFLYLCFCSIYVCTIVQLGLDFKLNTKIGLDTTHHHTLLGHFQAY